MKRKEFLQKSALGLVGGLTFSALKAGRLEDAASTTQSFNPLADQVGYNHLPIKSSKIMANMVLHRAQSRGHANHGWLDSNHTFSFANYYDPERMNFGVLRVLNDDQVAPGKGFGTHPHENMEIISIPLEGDLEHQDSMGNKGIIKQGDVQVMSAGTGVKHSEYNKNNDRHVKFLQIWLFPKKKGVEPRYDQMTFDRSQGDNKLQQVLSPNPDDAGVWIHQDAWFHMGQLEKGHMESYQLKKQGNGIYVFLIDGSLKVNGQEMDKRDGLGVWDVTSIDIEATSDAEVLIMDIPMQLS